MSKRELTLELTCHAKVGGLILYSESDAISRLRVMNVKLIANLLARNLNKLTRLQSVHQLKPALFHTQATCFKGDPNWGSRKRVPFLKQQQQSSEFADDPFLDLHLDNNNSIMADVNVDEILAPLRAHVKEQVRFARSGHHHDHHMNMI